MELIKNFILQTISVKCYEKYFFEMDFFDGMSYVLTFIDYVHNPESASAIPHPNLFYATEKLIHLFSFPSF